MKKVFLVLVLVLGFVSCQTEYDLEPEPIIIGWDCYTQIYYIGQTPHIPLGYETFRSFIDATGTTPDGSRVTTCSPIYSE